MWTKVVWGAIVLLVALPVTAQTPALLLFGGDNNRTFLGCLNCGKHDVDSVCNKFGQHGSRFAVDSIWNKFGLYGSKFAIHSPWNKFSISGPVIVDRDGGFYGVFSANQHVVNRTKIRAFLFLLDRPELVNTDPDVARDLFCGE